MDVTNPTDEQLRTGLRGWARGLYPMEAAVELLAEHRCWLGRSGLRRAALWISDDGPEFLGVDLAAASEFADSAAASSGEFAMIADRGWPVRAEHPWIRR